MKSRRWHRVPAAVALLSALSCSSGEGEEGESPFILVADVQQLMDGVIEPAADTYWNAVGVVVDADGEHQMAPQTDQEWMAVSAAAWTLAESGNLLMMDGRAVDQGAWITMSQSLIEVSRRAIEAAEARNLDAVFDMGAEVYYVCTNCHATYALETLDTNDTRAN